MSIAESTIYRLTHDGERVLALSIIREGDEIPEVVSEYGVVDFDSAQEAEDWCLQEEIECLVSWPTVAVPYEVTRRQLFLVLDSELSLTRETIRNMLSTEAQRIEFDEAQTFHRDHPLLNSLAATLELTSEQVDALFIAASQL